MPAPPNRRAHLDAWRSMADHRHQSGDPIINHFEYVESRVKDLDSAGFDWSKDSVIGIVLQLGLPATFPDSYDGVNDTLDKLATSSPSSECITPRQVKEAIKSHDDRLKSPKVSFLDLPTEIIGQILQLVRDFAPLEADNLKQCRAARVSRNHDGWQGKGLNCLHHQAPWLNSFQSLAVVNQKLHQKCLPLLWEKLVFPTSLPAPIDFWINDILPRQGKFVRTLDMLLSRRCVWEHEINPYQGETWPTDNEDFCVDSDSDYVYMTEGNAPGLQEDYYREDLGPESVIALLAGCPNLEVINFSVPEIGNDGGDGADWYTFSEDLTEPMSEQSKLQHLGWDNSNSPTRAIAERHLVTILESIPMLSSFSCTVLFTESRYGESQSLGQCLASLKHLSKLRLEQVDCIDLEWSELSWTSPLTTLELVNCKNLDFALIQKFTHLFSNALGRLELCFPNQHNPRQETTHLFDLPRLTELDLENSGFSFLSSFKNCKNISNISYVTCSDSDWSLFYKLIISSTWPNLKLIEISGAEGHTAHNQARIKSTKIKLKTHCESIGIELVCDF